MSDSQYRNTEYKDNSSLADGIWLEAALSRFASGTGISLVGRVLGRALFATSQIMFARFLGPEKFGLYSIGWTMLQMGGTIAPLGLDKGVIRYATQYWKSNSSRLKGVIIQSIGISILSGAILGLVLYFSASIISRDAFKNSEMTTVIKGFAPAFMMITAIKVIAATTRVTQRMRYSVILEDLLPHAISLSLFIPLFLIDSSLNAAIQASVFGFLLSFLLGILIVHNLFPEIFIRQLKWISSLRELITFALPSWLASAFFMFILWINRLLIGVFLPESEVGIFQASSQIAQLLTFATTAITATFSPMIASLYHRNQGKELQELFVISTKWGLYLTLPLFCVTIAAPNEVLEILFGDGYLAGVGPLIILSIGQIINISSGAVGWMLIMTGHQIKWFWNTTIMLLLSILINIFLTPRYGIIGTAIATSIGLSMVFVSGLIQVRYTFGYWPYDRRYLKLALSILVMILLTMMTLTVDIFNSIIRIIITLTGAILSVLFVLKIFGLDHEDREILKLVMQRFKREVT